MSCAHALPLDIFLSPFLFLCKFESFSIFVAKLLLSSFVLLLLSLLFSLVQYHIFSSSILTLPVTSFLLLPAEFVRSADVKR